jgi:signal transduction histidine kinase
MTNKLYTLEDDRWKVVDFPVTGKIAAFDAISRNDIWFSTTQENSTSLLYHFHDGITENMSGPLANDITSISFESPDLGFFASYSDLAVYSKGAFERITPLAKSGYIFSISGFSSEKFWVLNQDKKLIEFDRGKFSTLFPGYVIWDFKLTGSGQGFLLCDSLILEIKGATIVRQGRSPLLKNAKTISVHNNEVWVLGEGGLILVWNSGVFRRIRYEGNEHLNSIAFGRNNDIWIAGENGLLLYSGSKKFPEYNVRYPGFSAQKLISYGVDVDNEYGVAMADFNGDDYTDIYAVCISDPDRMFINSGSKVPSPFSFREEAAKRGATGITRDVTSQVPGELKLGVSVADIDNDGDEDLYLCSLNEKNKLLLNEGAGYFRNVSDQEKRACDNMNRSNAAAFADVDLDGDLDVFVTSELGSNRMFLNDGNGYFVEVTYSAGLGSTGGGMCASFSDVNGDGYPDLCVTFWYPANRIYLNETRNGKVRFRDITWSTDLASAPPAKSNAVVFTDINNDGFPDLFITSRFEENRLYLNDGKGNFKDITAEWFSQEVYLSYGAVFADFDLDGYQDLYLSNVGENVMYRNVGGKRFEEVTGVFGTELSGYCTGSATGDIDNDGDADIYAANYINGSSVLFVNKLEKRNSVTFKLSGTLSNRSAIGAKIYLYSKTVTGGKDSLAGFREISGGSGYASISAKEAIFYVRPGMDYFAVVRFPASGKSLTFKKIVPGTVIRVNEETGYAAFKTLSGKAVHRFFTNPEIRLEYIKYLVVVFCLALYLFISRKRDSQVIVIRVITSIVIFILFALVNQVFIFSASLLLFLVSPAFAFMCLVFLHLSTERILIRRQAEREKTELREKISRDLHDDLASTLGCISIYSSTLKGMTGTSQLNFQYLSAKISDLTQTALQSITDIIWMTAPRNDSLQSLLSKTNAMMFDVLTDNMISFDEKIDMPQHELILKDKLRHDTFLIMKEALNNIIRHASAKHVTLRAWISNSSCYISLQDDGKGFAASDSIPAGPHGNGLINMRRRAAESGIELDVQSSAGSGTRVEISFKI